MVQITELDDSEPSELRQRKGEKPKSNSDEASRPGEMENKDQLVNQVADLLHGLKPQPKPGLSNNAKQLKDKLLEDPFNMNIILALGKAYGADDQWDRCANVMLRGMKRTEDLEDPRDRFEFSVILAQASLNTQKYRQALAVLNEVKSSPDDLEEDALTGLEILKCQVYCFNGDMTKGLKAFNKAIEGKDFQMAVSLWASCSTALKKAGAWAATKSALLLKADTDTDKAKVESIEKLTELKDQYLESTPPMTPHKILALAGAVVAVMLLIFFLFHLEARSLANLKMTK
jgi:tetratricopeptide (TPR) repeat protein